MKKYLFDLLLKGISKVASKKVLYISSTYPSPSTLAVKSKYGFWYCGNVFNQQDIAYGIANNGTVEDFDTDTVLTILKEIKEGGNFVFYDIGANTGWYTMVALSSSQKSIVYSFEPVKEHVDCLTETIHLNQEQSRSSIYPIALSDKNGTSKILLAGTGSSLESDFLEVNNGTQEVSLHTLDSYSKNNNLKNPDFIKIDVEGHEYKVLQGAKNLLSESKPVLFVEVAYTLKKAQRHFTHKNYDDIFTLMKDMGYVSYRLHNNEIKKFTVEQKEDGVFMFLFLHPEKHHLLIKKFEKK
jgi:FkbM family methyltransferase